MRRLPLGFITGLVVGLVLSIGIATASPAIRLVINGQEIKTDVPPQMIDGRVMVPARYVAEPLGATVEFKDNSVIITSKGETGGSAMQQSTTQSLTVNGKHKYQNLLVAQDGDYFVSGRVILDFTVEKYHDNSASFGLDGVLVLQGQQYEIPSIHQPSTQGGYRLFSLNALKEHGLASEIQWDPATASLTIR